MKVAPFSLVEIDGLRRVRRVVPLRPIELPTNPYGLWSRIARKVAA